MDNDGSIEISHKSIVSPSICIVCTYCFNGGDILVCNMQGDYIKVFEQAFQYEYWSACQVTSVIIDANIAIEDVGSFYNDTVKNLMQQLMILDLSPYWPERVK